MENHGGMIWTGKNDWFASRAFRQGHQVAKHEELAEKRFWPYEISLFILEGFFNIQKNLTIWGRRLWFPSERRRAADFYLLPSAGFEPANLGSNNKHANHQTTEDNNIWLSFAVFFRHMLTLVCTFYVRRTKGGTVCVGSRDSLDRRLSLLLSPEQETEMMTTAPADSSVFFHHNPCSNSVWHNGRKSVKWLLRRWGYRASTRRHWRLWTAGTASCEHTGQWTQVCYWEHLRYLQYDQARINPLRPSGNYMNHLLWKSVILHFVFIGFI
jgi:hypothetical protein